MKLSISRYDPELDNKPYLQDYEIELVATDHMILDVLLRVKAQDNTLSFRKSCREGVCGSDAMNINGRNGLDCITRTSELREPVVIHPLPGFPIIRDLVVGMTRFFKQYHSIKPYLVNPELPPEKERLQSPAERDKLNGAYECILCGCCSGQWRGTVRPRHHARSVHRIGPRRAAPTLRSAGGARERRAHETGENARCAAHRGLARVECDPRLSS